MTYDLDVWPLTNFDLINKWGFTCCIYDPTLVEIHQSMWKIEPNVNPFSQQTTDNNTLQTTSTDSNSNSGQSDPYVSFLLRAGDTKKEGHCGQASPSLFLVSAPIRACVWGIFYIQSLSIVSQAWHFTYIRGKGQSSMMLYSMCDQESGK